MGSLLMSSGFTALIAGGVVAILWELTGMDPLHTIAIGAEFGGAALALLGAQLLYMQTRELREEQ